MSERDVDEFLKISEKQGIFSRLKYAHGGVISGPLSIGYDAVGTTTASASSTSASAAVVASTTAPAAVATESANSGSLLIDLQQNRQLNDKGADIRLLQKFLNANGFIVAKSGPGSTGNETSIFGLHTYQALKKFQSVHGLPATGFLGPMTRGIVSGR